MVIFTNTDGETTTIFHSHEEATRQIVRKEINLAIDERFTDYRERKADYRQIVREEVRSAIDEMFSDREESDEEDRQMVRDEIRQALTDFFPSRKDFYDRIFDTVSRAVHDELAKLALVKVK